MVYQVSKQHKMETNNKYKIFLVDDDAFCLSFYREHLAGIGYDDVTGFGNGADCLNQLTQQPDVIFLDYGMDNLTGIEVLKKIKRFNPDIYVVFLSGQANIMTAVNALKFGAFDYIVKGINELDSMTKVLRKVDEIKELMKKEKPTLINKLFSF
jgi:DNA-binding NtrC family response regulator